MFLTLRNPVNHFVLARYRVAPLPFHLVLLALGRATYRLLLHMTKV